jgi:DNA repair protein RecN (Recombination protein N)
MLRFLSVRHLAVIDQLEVEFDAGFNVLTGETGAGKSVLVEAIGLLVGGRASADLVRTGEPQAVVQAIVERPGGGEVIIRREISAQGRSRAFIDEALATSVALKELGADLIELHGQHEHQALLDPAEHVDLLDAFAQHPALTAAVSTAYDAWRVAADAIDRSQLGEQEKRARIELAAFQLQEIDKVAPRAGEDDALAAERRVLANADRLRRLGADAYAALYEGEQSALAALGTVWKRVAHLAEIDPVFAAHLEQRDAIKPLLEDLAFALRRHATSLDASPERLQAVEDRLAALERLKRRFGPGLDDVLARRAALAAELEALDATAEQAQALADRERVTRGTFEKASAALRRSRELAAATLGPLLAADLKELALPHCRMEVRLTPLGAPDLWSRRGQDAVAFFFSPNPGEDLRPLDRIASGGELSRVMLALRLATVGQGSARTVIFDEVDSGIGGAAADAVGARLQALGRVHQVLCVTHLAQIAARAGTHLLIEKRVERGRTRTSVSRLDSAGREREVARMIAGATVSPQILASARELLARRQTGEHTAKGESESRPAEKAKGKRGG